MRKNSNFILKNGEDPEPENFLNDGTSHGIVPLAVPSPLNALIRPRTWSWHLQRQQAETFQCV